MTSETRYESPSWKRRNRLDPFLNNIYDWSVPVCYTAIGLFFVLVVTYYEEVTTWLVRP